MAPITPRSNVHLFERIEVTLQRRARDCSASALEQPDFLDLVSFIVLYADIVKSLSRRALETRTISRSSEQYRSSSAYHCRSSAPRIYERQESTSARRESRTERRDMKMQKSFVPFHACLLRCNGCNLNFLIRFNSLSSVSLRSTRS